MTYDEVLKRFRVKSRHQDRAQATCPSHDDKQASLTITRGERGTLLFCHAGCALESVLEAAGLQKSDLFYNNKPRSSWQTYVESREKRRLEAKYDYVFLNGTYAYTKLRLQDKKFVYGRLQDGKFWYGLTKPRRELSVAVYGDLKALKQAISDGKTTFYCEGEKDTRAMAKQGYAAITAGSVNDWQPAVAQLYKAADVVILADNDQPGQALAERVRADLQGIAKSVGIVTPMPDTPHADISDFFANHNKDEFEKLIAGTTVTEKTVAQAAKPKQSLVSRLFELKAAERFATNDKGSAELFAEVFKDTSRYCPTRRDFMFYDGTRWELDTEGLKARRNAKKLADALLTYAVKVPDLDETRRQEYLKYAARLMNYRDRNTMVNDTKDLNFFDSAQLDANDYLLNCGNGVLDLSGDTPKLLEHSADLLLSKVCGANYDPAARCDLWERTVAEIMQDDTAKIKYLQKIFGIALTGCTKEEQMYVFFGATTRNGKSTITETALSLLGDYAATIAPETLAIKQNKDSRTASPDVAKLAGVRLVVASEPPKRMLFDTSLIKTLTGRDTVTARFLHENEFSFKPKFKLVLNTNYLPTISDNTVFKSERIRVISFDKHFAEDEQNKNLKSELRRELDGILNWAVDGLYLYRKEGLSPPEAVKAATSEYEADSDKIQRFISECLVKSEKNMAAKTAYDKYAKWCDESGCGTESKTNFFAELRTRGVFAACGTVEGKTVKNIIRGYELADEGFAKVDDDSPLPFD